MYFGGLCGATIRMIKNLEIEYTLDFFHCSDNPDNCISGLVFIFTVQ